MESTLQARLAHFATGKTIGVLFGLVLVINGLIFPWVAERITAGSQDIGPIDLLFSYTPEQVLGMVHAYGDNRTFYAVSELTIDVIYPI
jgi:hypothetical protein